MTRLTITTDVDGYGRAILGIAGRIDTETVCVVTDAVTAVLGSHRIVHLVLDLARVTHLAVAALDALLLARGNAVRCGATFRVIRPQPPVRRVMDLTGTCELLTR